MGLARFEGLAAERAGEKAKKGGEGMRGVRFGCEVESVARALV